MLVYGDPQFTTSAQTFLKQLRARLQRVDTSDPDQLRPLLIQSGQFEQGLWDSSDANAPQPDEDLSRAMQLTDAAAQVLFHGIKSADQLALFTRCLDQLEHLKDLPLAIKIPEGFEFYALFPEQYFHTATNWARQFAPRRSVLVIGIRSIGTSLSAVVRVALQTAGCRAERLTVRPTGHPFQRQAVLKRFDPADWAAVIIVDEGPGLSGSSVAGVCKALEAQGFDPKQFHIFPGHDRDPGVSSSPDVRRWWSNTARWFTPSGELAASLLARSAKLIPDWGASPRIEDAGAGNWRRLLDLPENAWPVAMVPFERPKYRCGSDRGTKILWKFVGLGAAYEPGRTGAEFAVLKSEALAKAGFSPPPLGVFNGFIAMPWIDGSPLELRDASDDALFERIAQYAIRFAGPPLSPDEIVEAQDRLTAMIETNTREALGADWASLSVERANEDRELKVLQSYGDGHLAPHEWLRDARGSVFKTDCFGHDVDHTCMGKQSLLWDVAGFSIEWALPKARVENLLHIFNQQGVCVDDRTFEFYQLGYAAFRMGLCAVSADIVADERDKARLQSARKRYCQILLKLLG